MRIPSAKAFLGRLGASAIPPKDDAARVEDERDETNSDNAEASEFRREVLRKQGRGVLVDKTI